MSCSNCDSPMSSQFFSLYDNANVYGQLIVNAIFAAALLVVFFVNQKPAAKVVHVSTFCLFTACIFQCVRWGLIIPDNWIPHGYRWESTVIVTMQRIALPVVLGALIRAMRPGKILALGPWLGVVVLSVLNLAYVVFDFMLTDSAIKAWVESGDGPWRLGDRDFSLLWTKSMVGRYTDQPAYSRWPINWDLSSVVRYRVWLLFDPSEPKVIDSRDAQIKIGLAADTVALLVVLAVGVLHLITWRRQGKAEVPRHRTFLAVAVGGLLLSTLFRVITVANWILPNWRIITNVKLWNNWLSYFPDTNRMEDYVLMPPYWLPGYRSPVGAFPILQVIFEQIGPIMACGWIVLSMVAERRQFKMLKQQEAMNMKMQMPTQMRGQYN